LENYKFNNLSFFKKITNVDFIREVFELLYKVGIISEESFKSWRADETGIKEGKEITLDKASEFFQFLENAEEEKSDE